jgi:hypothetical protein
MQLQQRTIYRRETGLEVLLISFVIKMKPYHIFSLSVQTQNLFGAQLSWQLGHLTDLGVLPNFSGGSLD